MSSKLAEKERKLAALREMIRRAVRSEAPGDGAGPSGESSGKVMAAATRLLGARDHGRNELKRKLRTRGFGADEIADVLERCERLGYLDDARCCERYYDELTDRGYGSLRVRATMLDKGFAEDVIDGVFSLRREEADEMENARRALRKKLPTFERVADNGKRREKMYRFLQSRGFPPDVVLDAIRESAPGRV